MPTKKQRQTVFTLTVDSQKIAVRCRPSYIGGKDPYALIEFESPYEPRRRIPVSETGYRSYFAPMHEVKAASSIEAYAREVAIALIANGKRPRREDADQLPLF